MKITALSMFLVAGLFVSFSAQADEEEFSGDRVPGFEESTQDISADLKAEDLDLSIHEAPFKKKNPYQVYSDADDQ
jgi:outer membrane lipoprotein-sorting protein